MRILLDPTAGSISGLAHRLTPEVLDLLADPEHELRHTLHVSALPLHHRDPFDRLLIAQAQLENLHLLTSDQALAPYEETRFLWT